LISREIVNTTSADQLIPGRNRPHPTSSEVGTFRSAGQNDYTDVDKAMLAACGYDDENSRMIETTIAGSAR